MTGKGRKANPKVAQAGARNLARWKAENPDAFRKAALKHGAWSKHTRKRYGDLRTREGKQLKAIITGLVSDLGGPSELTAAMLDMKGNDRLALAA